MHDLLSQKKLLLKILFIYLLIQFDALIYIFDSDLVWRTQLMIIKG